MPVTPVIINVSAGLISANLGRVILTNIEPSQFNQSSFIAVYARVSRRGRTLYIYSEDLRFLLAKHEVTWSSRDSYCEEQYAALSQPEEFPTMPVRTKVKRLSKTGCS